MHSSREKFRSMAALTSPQAVRPIKFHYPFSMNDYDDENDLRFCCLSFRPDNKIHLFPPCKPIVFLLRDTVEKNWPVDSEDQSMDCFTLNLKGTPFLMYSRRENAMLVKYICCLILERFRVQGWSLAVCTDLSRRADLTAWYFLKATNTESAPVRPPTEPALICLSLSAKRKLQLINAPPALHEALYYLVSISYDLGIDQDSHYGRDYQIKLKGTPWDTEDRDEIVGACELVAEAFDTFGRQGYHFYGLVNLKDTADSFFFEYDPNKTTETDGYMVVALDGNHILRLAKADRHIVEVVKTTVDKYWPLGLEAEGQIACGRHRSVKTAGGQPEEETVSWEFVLKGSPWDALAAKIGHSRQFVTYLLDALLANGWTAITGLDISRSSKKKSALLFKRCQPLQDHHRHVCLSPLGKQRYQLINAPASLRRLVREEFRDVLMHDKTSDHQTVFEMTFSGRPWWVLIPEQERESYIFIRKRMGRLLQVLTDAGWRLVASAAVARETQEDKEASGDIHSWFLLGSHEEQEESVVRSGARAAKQAKFQKGISEDHNGRAAEFGIPGHKQLDGKGRRAISATGSRSVAAATQSKRVLSPPPGFGVLIGQKQARSQNRLEHSQSGSDPRLNPSRAKLSNAMKSGSTDK